MIRYFILATLLTISIFIIPIHAQQQTMHELPDGAITRLGKGGINVMQFSPDGKRLAVGTDIGIWLYDVATGKEIPLPNKVIAQVNAVTFSANSNILACCGYFNRLIQIWDIETVNELPHISVPISERIIWNGITEIPSVIDLTFTNNDTILIGVDHTGKFLHWDLNTYKLVSEQQKFSLSNFKSSTLSKDGSLFLTGYHTGEITMWDPHTGNRVEILSGHKPKIKLGKKRTDIRALVFSPDRNMFASGSEDLSVQLWNTERRKVHAYLKGHKGWVTAIAFSNDGKTIASGDTNGIINVWDTTKRRRIATLEAHKNTINALAFSPDGKTLTSGSADGKILFWNQDTWENPATFVDGHTEWVKAIAFSSDNATISTAMFNNTVQKYDVYTGTKLSDFSAAQQNLTQNVALSPDASILACYPITGIIAFNAKQKWHTDITRQEHENTKIWELNTGKELPSLIQSSGMVTFSQDSRLIALNSSVLGKKRALGNPFRTYTSVDYQGIYIWNVRTGEKITHLQPKRTIWDQPFTFSPKGTKLVTQGSSSMFETLLWDVENQQKPITLKERVDAVAFSPDGTLLATIASFDIYLFDTVTGKKLRKLVMKEGDAVDGTAITFSPEGSILLISKMPHILPFCMDTIELFDVKTSRKLLSLPGHTETIETLVFSHDGKVLASGSKDGTVILWDWYKILNKITMEK